MSLMRKYFLMTRGIFTLCLYAASVLTSAQETESRKVEFHLNTTPDREGPEITVLSPEMDEQSRYVSEVPVVEVLGEVKDRSKIRFVSVNTDVQVVNESGVFASKVKLAPGENRIQFKSMDEHGNFREAVYVIDYVPPVITLAEKINRDSRYFGLIIGIEKYKDPGIADLDRPVEDAEDVYRALVTNYTFDQENVILLRNPKRADIIRELDGFRSRITPQDNLLIFYAGHGYWDEDAGVGYWLPSDASQETTADWFRNSTLVDYLQAIHSRHTLLITDACFAGSIFKSRSVSLDKEVVYDRIYEIPSRKAMTSGAMTEVPDESAFVKYLVKQLDQNQEKYLSSEELFSSFRMAVISNSSVLPQYGEIQNVGNEGGDFIFLKREE